MLDRGITRRIKTGQKGSDFMCKRRLRNLTTIIAAIALAGTLAACGNDTGSSASSKADSSVSASAESSQTTSAKSDSKEETSTTTHTSNSEATPTSANVSSTGAIDASELFTERDLEQTADLSEAKTCTVSDGQTIEITEEGVYVIEGTASNAEIIINAADEDKVQLVLSGVSITNDSQPAIYVKNADKVFITTSSGTENTLSVTGTFTEDGDTNTDAVIFSKDDIVLSGQGILNINSTDNGISGKDDMKVTGGTINITAADAALEVNDGIAIADGTINITTSGDGLHAENDDDNSQGWVYICGGTLNIQSQDDGIHATTIAQFDGGTVSITAAEGIEGTWIQMNDGTIEINATDDGINAGNKSSSYTVAAEINGGSLTINMGQGDTDAIDSNGNLAITGGTLNINAQSPFDYDGTLTHTGGTIYVNGTETTEITSQMMGGGMGGGIDGGMGGGRMGGPGGH